MRLERVLQRPIDWQQVLDKSWWHRVRPLTYRNLSQQSSGLVPAAVLEVLGSQTQELEARNARLFEMLRRVCELFDQASLPMLVFKGPTLARDAYGDLGLRECGDLDLLIRPEDFEQVREMLGDAGFSCLWDQEDSSRKRQVFACEFRRDGVELDVHWDLAPRWLNYEVDFDLLWDNGTSVFSEFPWTRKLQAEDSLQILSMHASRHWWDRLRWICDIAELVNSGKIRDWDVVEAHSTDWRCSRSVWLGLWLASSLLDAKLPTEIRQNVDRFPAIERLGSQVNDWLRQGETAIDTRNLPVRFMFRMRLCDRWRDRIPQISHYLATLPSRRLHWNP